MTVTHEKDRGQRSLGSTVRVETNGDGWNKLTASHVQGGPKNETTLVRPTAATVQDKIKRISLKCSQRLRK